MVRDPQQNSQLDYLEDEANLSQLFKLHDQIVLFEPIQIPELFGKEPEQTVAFEVALAALIATAVLSVTISVSVLEVGVSIAAILLLAVTVVRKMLLDNPFVNTNTTMQKTTSWMQNLITLSVIYLAIFITESVFAAHSGNTLLVVAGVLIVGIFGLMLAYEFTIGDLFFWSAVKFHNLAIRNGLNYFTHGLLKLARTMLDLTPQAFNNEHPAVRKIRYQGSETRARKSQEFTISLMIVATIGVLGIALLVTAPIFYLLAGWGVFYTVTALVLLGLASLLLQSLLQFILSRYGNASFDEVTGLREDVLPVMIVLSVALVYELERVGILLG